MRRATAPAPIITRINVTPLIDVALVLVIILLVTAPMLPASDLSVNLPSARTREAEDERNVSITLSANGDIALDHRPLGRGQLRSALAERLEAPGNRGVLVVLRADTAAPYWQVRGVLSEARAAGAKRLAIATRQHVEGHS